MSVKGGGASYRGADRRTRSAGPVVVRPAETAKLAAAISVLAALPLLFAYGDGLRGHAAADVLRLLSGSLAVGAGLAILLGWRISGQARAAWLGVALVDLGLFGFACYGLPAPGASGSVPPLNILGRLTSTALVVPLIWRALRAPDVEAPLRPVRLVGLSATGGFCLLGVLTLASGRGLLDAVGSRHLSQVTAEAITAVLWLAPCCTRTAAVIGTSTWAWLRPMFGLLAVSEIPLVALPTGSVADVVSGLTRLVALALALAAASIELHRMLHHQDRYAHRLRLDVDSLRHRVDQEEAALQERFHDLQNAVAGMRSADATLRRYAARLDEKTRTTLAEALTAELSRLQSLLIEPVRPTHLVDVSLDEVLGPVVAAERTYGSDLEIDLAGLSVRADPDFLAQVTQNVLINARRYAPGTPASLFATVQGTTVEIRIIDRGPGIPDSERHQIFERGARGTGSDGTPGTGLGLFVAARMMADMDGSISVEDHLDGGACFLLRLPAARPPNPQPRRPLHLSMSIPGPG